MFCPFFVQTNLCEGFARFIYNNETEEAPVESGSSASLVRIDRAASCKDIQITENHLGSKFTYHLRGRGKALGDTQII